MADGSKTEQATPKRRSKARESGQLARSRELPGVFALAGVAGATALMALSSLTHWSTLYRNAFYVASTGNFDSNGPLFFWSSVEVMRWIAPILLTAMMLSLYLGPGIFLLDFLVMLVFLYFVGIHTKLEW